MSTKTKKIVALILVYICIISMLCACDDSQLPSTQSSISGENQTSPTSYSDMDPAIVGIYLNEIDQYIMIFQECGMMSIVDYDINRYNRCSGIYVTSLSVTAKNGVITHIDENGEKSSINYTLDNDYIMCGDYVAKKVSSSARQYTSIFGSWHFVATSNGEYTPFDTGGCTFHAQKIVFYEDRSLKLMVTGGIEHGEFALIHNGSSVEMEPDYKYGSLICEIDYSIAGLIILEADNGEKYILYPAS